MMHAFLKSPAVQTYLTKKAASFLSKELDTEVKVGGVDIAFFLDIVFEEVSIKDQKGESLLFINKLIVDIESISLLRNQIIIDNIEFDQPYIGLRKYKDEEDLNFTFLLDYFSSEKKQTDTATTQWDIVVYSFDIVDGRLLFHDYNKKRKSQGIDFANLDVDSLNLNVVGINILNDTILLDLENFSLKESSGVKLKKLSSEIALFPNNLYATSCCP